MRVSAETKQKIEQAKIEAADALAMLRGMLTNLNMAPGAKGHANKLGKIIGQLEAWQAK